MSVIPKSRFSMGWTRLTEVFGEAYEPNTDFVRLPNGARIEALVWQNMSPEDRKKLVETINGRSEAMARVGAAMDVEDRKNQIDEAALQERQREENQMVAEGMRPSGPAGPSGPGNWGGAGGSSTYMIGPGGSGGGGGPASYSGGGGGRGDDMTENWRKLFDRPEDGGNANFGNRNLPKKEEQAIAPEISPRVKNPELDL